MCEMNESGNMDETPMNFDMLLSCTINSFGERTIATKTTGTEKNHFTVVCMFS